MEKQLKLPIGIEDFTDIRKLGFYYVDKTGLIKELLENWGRVNLFTRPRRFGKTLNMSMMKSFFEIGCDRSLFDGLTIAEEGQLCEEYMGKFPVISISLKSVAGEDFETARSMVIAEIRREARRFQFLLGSSVLTAIDKNLYLQLADTDILDDALPDSVLMNSLLNLSALLRKHYQQKVIILIDEYDVPLDKAFEQGYYEKMVTLLKNMFQQALKTNDSLYFAVLTGCLRIAKESIFTGLNNFKVLSITNVKFDEYFGFTDDEVKGILNYYGLMAHGGTIKQWYDGYRFGNVAVYCPWDVLCYCDELLSDKDAKPEAYWIHTSSNSIVKRFIRKANKRTRQEIERLIEGESISKTIRQELTYNELDSNIDNLWSVLFTTGYLTYQGEPEDGKYQLTIPNLEINKIFVTQIKEWFEEVISKDPNKLAALCMAFKEGDVSAAEERLNAYLMQTISIRDTFVHKEKKENFYHGILLGLLSYEQDWLISSNAESGDGYSDILIEIEEEQIGIVIEIKYAGEGRLDSACAEAIEQIEQKMYTEKLRMDGMKSVLKYGIACYRKGCRVVKEEAKL